MRRLLMVLMLCCPLFARAGTACETKPMGTADFVKAMNLADKARLALDSSGAQVALIARVGQDLSKYHLRYSHMAYVWRSAPQQPWRIVHELNDCGSASSALYEQGLGNFFLDDMFAYDTKIVIPDPADQARLAAMLASRTALRFHSAHYNMLAFPFSTEYQNSNQWVLETYAMAVAGAPIGGRAQAQDWLYQSGYRATTLELSAMTRLGARLFRANVAFDDQPFDRRMAGLIDTVTVESVVRFVERRDARATEMVFGLP